MASHAEEVAGTGEVPPTSPLPGLFDTLETAAWGSAPAVVGSDGTLRYRDLSARAGRLAARWTEQSSPILVYGHKEPSMVVALLAALRCARAYVPLDPSTPIERARRMIAVAQPGIAVVTRPLPLELRDYLVSRGVQVFDIGPLAALVESWPSDLRPSAARPPEHAAYVLFTSGTTGDPKGVAVPYRALDHFLTWLLATYDFRMGEEVFLNQVPYTFDVSVVGLYGALLTGGTLFSVSYEEISNPRRLFSRLEGAPLTVWVSTPSLARICLAEPRFRASMLPNLKLFWLAGETLPPPMVGELLRRFPGARVWNAYGPTEATVVVTAIEVDARTVEAGGPVPIGDPLPGTAVWIADPTDPSRRLPDGDSGEIVVGGPQVALGYLQPGGAAGLVVPASPAGPFFPYSEGALGYRTGDLGHVDPADGRFYCHGRLDQQIKLHGYRIELEEIETLLREIPGIADAAVLVVDRDGRPDHLRAVLVPAAVSGGSELPGENFALSQWVRTQLASRLPAYALPRAAQIVAALPLSTSGKLDRRALQAFLT